MPAATLHAATQMDNVDSKEPVAEPKPPAADPRTPNWLIALRVWAALNLLGTLFLGLVGMIGAGLGGHGRGASLGWGYFAFVAFFLLVPLGVFAPRRWRAHGAFVGMGVLCMFATTSVFLNFGVDDWLKPWLVKRSIQPFEQVAEALSIERWSAEPIEIAGVAVGLRVTGVLRVARDIRSKDGTHVTGSPYYRGDITGSANLHRSDGKALSPLWSKRNADLVASPGNRKRSRVDLGEGEYTLSFELWRYGLEDRRGERFPCRRIDPDVLRVLAPLADTPSIPLRLRAQIRAYRSDRTHELLGASWDYRYDHRAWLEQLQRLPIEDCGASEAKAAAERQAREEANEQSLKESYLATTAPHDLPELRRGCEGDVALLRRLLGYGLPARSMAQLVWRCSGHREAFELLARTLYDVHDARSDYCDGVQQFVARQDVAAMWRLSEAKLPVLCARREDLEVLVHSANKQGSWAAAIAWLGVVQRMGLDLCAVGPGRQTLLQLVALQQAPQVVEFLLDQGCDPAVLPLPSASPHGQPYLSARLAWHARVIQTSLDEQQVAPITQRIGAVDRQELTRVDPRTGVTGPLLLTPPFRDLAATRLHPDVIRWLAQQGARLDAADQEGRSWYHSGYEQWPGTSPNHEILLKGLSPPQLRQLMQPRNLATGKPGIPLDGLADKSPEGLGGYLCSRGVGTC